MPTEPSRIARIYRRLAPDEDGPRRRPVPAGWALALAALLVLMLPIAVFGSVFGDNGGSDPDLAAIRVTEIDEDAASDEDDRRDPDDRDTTVRETVDGNTLRNGAYSITGNTKIGDTTERPTKDGNTLRNGANSITGNTKIGDTTERPTKDGNTLRNGANSITGNTRGADTTRAPARAAAPATPAAQGFAPAYGGGGDSVSGASGSASG